MKNENELCKGLNESAYLIHQNNKEKGFWDTERNVGELLMLVVSELGEAMESHRKGVFAKKEDFNTYINLGGDFETNFKEYIKDSFEDEIADAIIRLMDLEYHINQKVKYNKTRERLHGKRY